MQLESPKSRSVFLLVSTQFAPLLNTSDFNAASNWTPFNHQIHNSQKSKNSNHSRLLCLQHAADRTGGAEFANRRSRRENWHQILVRKLSVTEPINHRPRHFNSPLKAGCRIGRSRGSCRSRSFVVGGRRRQRG